VGGVSARHAERLTARAVALGARNLAAITPYYLPAGPRALVDYLVEAVAGADIALIKAGLALRGLPAGPPRVALDPPSPAQLDTLRHAIEELT
jgi:4-hydroxy-tetrahydrodipicolinate synthase